MKICSKCKCDKDLDQYAWRSKDKNQLHGQCNDCRKATAKKSYELNREKVVKAVGKRNQDYKEAALRWKSNLSCVICSEDYIKCVEFHHLDQSTKENDISGMISKYPLETILIEAAKCIVVCSNCHRKIHGGKIEVTNYLIEKSNQMIENISL